MRCSRLILIFGMLFCLSAVSLSYEKYTLKTLCRMKDRIDRAYETAADAAAENIRKGIYEPGAALTALTVFETVLDAALNDGNQRKAKIRISLNGEEIPSDEIPKRAKRGDTVVLSFEPEPEELNTPGRKRIYEKILVRSVVLD